MTFSSNEQDLLNDVELRAPLPPDFVVSTTSSELLHVPTALLCRMLVACKVLRLGQETQFTCCVLLHRYANSIFITQEQHEPSKWKWIGAACLFLGCKAEEEPRRLRDVINVAHIIEFENTTESYNNIVDTIKEPPALNQEYWDWKQHVVQCESEVLRFIKFDVLVSHPHRIVAILAEEVSNEFQLVKVAWRRINDALFDPRALEIPALPMACAALCLAIQEIHHDNKSVIDDMTQHWCQTLRVSKQDLANAKASLIRATAKLSTIAAAATTASS